MRFEITCLVFQLIACVFVTGKMRLHWRDGWLAFCFAAYSPGLFLANFDGVPLSLLVCSANILLFFRKTLQLLPFSVLLLMALSLGGSLIVSNSDNFLEVTAFIVFLVSSFLVGIYLAELKIEKLKALAVSSAIILTVGIIYVLQQRYFFEATIRDVGFVLPALMILSFFMSFGSGLFWKVVSFIYLASGLTRSVYLAVGFLSILFLKNLWMRLLFFLFLPAIFVVLSLWRFYKMNLGSETVFGFSTRLRGIITEFNDFSNAPLFGNGFAYFKSVQSMQLELQKQGLPFEYVAYNHNWMSSLLSQIGIVGFIIFGLIPITITTFCFLRPQKTERLRWLIFFQLTFIALCFMSGSVLRLDYEVTLYFITFFSTCSILARRNDRYA